MTITQRGVFCLGWFLSNGSRCINNDCVLDDASRVLRNRARMNKHRKLWETLPKGPRLARRAVVNHPHKGKNTYAYKQTCHTSADTQWLHILKHTHTLHWCPLRSSVTPVSWSVEHSTDAHGQRCELEWCHCFLKGVAQLSWHGDLGGGVWIVWHYINAFNQNCVYKRAQTWSGK